MRKVIPNFLYKFYSRGLFLKNSFKYRNKQKIFCIGGNKTGTTSLSALLTKMGFDVAPQRPAELLVFDWGKNDFKNIIRFVRNQGEAFQDVPFSLPGTFKMLDGAFPKSKFILTIRDTPEVYYNSVIKFAGKKFADGRIPNKQDLQKANYIYEGYVYEVNRLLYDTPEDDIYNKEALIKTYLAHNEEVENYFKDRPSDLLVVNLSDKDALKRISNFLGKEPIIGNMPWENKT